MYEHERIKEIIIDSDGTQKIMYPNCQYVKGKDNLYYPQFHVTWNKEKNGFVCPHCGNVEPHRTNWCNECKSWLIAVFPF